MIYTIGKKAAYDLHMKAQGDQFKKLGRGELQSGEYYSGGSVWRTIHEARNYLRNHQPRLKEYAVYGVLADWDTGTYVHPMKPDHRRLISTSQIVPAEQEATR